MKKTKGQYRRRLAFVFDACKGQKVCKGLIFNNNTLKRKQFILNRN
jgi:hypothetical protein